MIKIHIFLFYACLFTIIPCCISQCSDFNQISQPQNRFQFIDSTSSQVSTYTYSYFRTLSECGNFLVFQSFSWINKRIDYVGFNLTSEKYTYCQIGVFGLSTIESPIDNIVAVYSKFNFQIFQTSSNEIYTFNNINQKLNLLSTKGVISHENISFFFDDMSNCFFFAGNEIGIRFDGSTIFGNLFQHCLNDENSLNLIYSDNFLDFHVRNSSEIFINNGSRIFQFNLNVYSDEIFRMEQIVDYTNMSGCIEFFISSKFDVNSKYLTFSIIQNKYQIVDTQQCNILYLIFTIELSTKKIIILPYFIGSTVVPITSVLLSENNLLYLEFNLKSMLEADDYYFVSDISSSPILKYQTFQNIYMFDPNSFTYELHEALFRINAIPNPYNSNTNLFVIPSPISSVMISHSSYLYFYQQPVDMTVYYNSTYHACLYTSSSTIMVMYSVMNQLPTPCRQPGYIAGPALTESIAECIPCSAGYICQYSTSQISLSPQPCPASFYCNQSALFTPVAKCPAGFICETGTDQPVKCPTGYFCNQTGLVSGFPCSLGQLCLSGTIFPQNCSAGTYCITPSENLICPIYHYCPEGSSQPTSCPKCTSAGMASEPDMTPVNSITTTNTISSPSTNTVQNAIIGGSISGGVGLLFFMIKFIISRRAAKYLDEQLDEEEDRLSTTNQKRKAFIRDCVKPITIKIFEALDLSYIFGYRSHRMTKNYVSAIETMIGHLKAENVNLELIDMEPSEQLVLFNTIREEMVRQFSSQRYSWCSCQFYKRVATLFIPEVKHHVMFDQSVSLAKNIAEKLPPRFKIQELRSYQDTSVYGSCPGNYNDISQFRNTHLQNSVSISWPQAPAGYH